MRWDAYGCRVRGGLAIVSVDLDATEASGPWLGYVWLNAPRPDEDGICLDDTPRHRDLEDSLGGFCALIGRVTTGGRREIYVHLADSHGFVDTVSALLAHLPPDRWEAGISMDAEGDLLRRLLLPPPEVRGELEARSVAWAALPESGTAFLVHEADIAGDPDDFLAARTAEGFQILDLEDGTARFGRTEAFDRALAREVVLDLVRRVSENGGTYLGFSIGEPPAVA